MQKLVLFVGIAGLSFGGSHFALGQKIQTENPDTRSTAVNGLIRDSSIINKKADTSVIELSPVLLSANDNNPANLSEYNNLQPSINVGNLVTGNLNDYLLGFIKNYYEDNTKVLQAVQSKSSPYFNIIDKVFDQFGIPQQLKYLAVIESGLNTSARSRAGAVGTWQLMTGTARLLGLEVNRHRDDRRDLYKSTIAAAKYLTDLYNQFDNWLLVVAAYNCGPGGVMKAIDQSGSTNFWDLKKYLPQESQRHVMKFLATAYIFDRFASFFGVDKSSLLGDYLTPITNNASFVNTNNLAVFQISGKYSLPVIAKFLSMSITELNRLNPGFDKLLSGLSGTYDLHLPPNKMVVFKENRNAILNESVELLMENNRQLADAGYPAPAPLPKNSRVNKG
ncbi:MAG: lytic transglycosylase domain-containing protein [Chitinophagaceae bacterium]